MLVSRQGERHIRFAFLLAALVLGGCASTPAEDLLASTQVVRQLARERGERVEVARFSLRRPGEALRDPWEPYIISPAKPLTEYRLVQDNGRAALQATADQSASGLVRRIRIDPQRHPVLEWRWQVANLIPQADVTRAATDDAVARLIVSFHGDPQRLDFHDRAQLRLANAVSGQALPFATLMYIWSSAQPVGSVIEHPRTDRIRMIVVASGAGNVGKWREYRRNVIEDYKRAFGDEPWDIVAVGVMTDSDNTGQKARCLYGDITFHSQ